MPCFCKEAGSVTTWRRWCHASRFAQSAFGRAAVVPEPLEARLREFDDFDELDDDFGDDDEALGGDGAAGDG